MTRIERFPNSGTFVENGPPYSKAVRAGDLVFVSGQVAVDDGGKPVGGGIVPETRQTIENLRNVLQELGLDLKDVVKTMVWLTDVDDFDLFNSTYVAYFGEALPARACVHADLMGPFRVEIEAIARVL
ncbi:RidA family protein [Roseibium salinum]|uniref:Rid family hydrolase n=1 Tax=Roseibium salinum TaxID=1604349 RepID=A0ABT3QWB4_9HYPH|nr:Rid family hydrolase [Roseibium sp. DSM 29163]MCX2721218.1 Rid family hydrolase [Roseibium sp. DSM 29163]